MTTVRVVPMAPHEFGVEVEEGDQVTGHRVTVPESFLENLLLDEADLETVIRESFSFLLEREPATSILREFSLYDIARYFPEFPDELRRRLS
jgi:hypothetical protein